MRRCFAAGMRGAGFRATYPLSKAVVGRSPDALPVTTVKKLPQPATRALRAFWKQKRKDCRGNHNSHGNNNSVSGLCSTCRFFAANPSKTRELPIELDIYNTYSASISPIVVASAVMGLLGQRVPVPQVNPAEVFECLNILDTLGEEDRLAVECGMYKLLYDSTDPSAAVLAFFVRPAEGRHRAAPTIIKYLESLAASLKGAGTPPPTTDDDAPENAALKDYLRALKVDKGLVRAVVSLIRGVPARYKNRCDILFAMHLKTLLWACAHEVWSGVIDTTATSCINEMLATMRSKPLDAASGPPETETLESGEDEVTFETLRDRDDWHPRFTKAVDPLGTGFILESKNRDGEKQRVHHIIHSVYEEGEEYVLRLDKTESHTILNFAHLAHMLKGFVPVPQLTPFDPSLVLLPGIELNAGIPGDVFPEMLGDVSRDKDMDPCLEQQLLKRHCTLVNGGSGTGKTVFSTTILPRTMYQNPLVLHKIIKEKDATLAEIKKLDEDYYKDLTNDQRKELQHLFASCALRRRRESAPYADAADYPGWMEACSTILGVNQRNEWAKEYVLDVLKGLLGKKKDWVKATDGVERYPNTVVLVLDELGKCLPLARAIISAQYSIYMDDWVRNHFAKLELVLCGTGTEMAVSSSSLFIATDPTSVNVITLLKPNSFFLEVVFLRSLLGKRMLLPDTVAEAKKKAQGLYPLLYSQYLSSALFNDAKTNTRLYLQSCYFLKTILNNLDKNATDVPEELDRKHTTRMDSCFARTVGLDGCVRLAIPWFIRCNGLGLVREQQDQMAIDAALASALQRVHPLIPLPPLHESGPLMERASTLGLIVRRSGEIPSPALTAVITFGYTEPCAAKEGYTQEHFTAEWASRLVEVQTGYAAPIVSLPFCLPWKEREPPTAGDVASLLEKLRDHKALVLLNGPSAPGADVMVVQLRRPYDEVKTRMSQETYRKLYPDGVAAIVTVISNKQRSKGLLQQALTLGVVNLEELLASTMGTVKQETWCRACDSEREARQRAVNLFSEIDAVFNPNVVAKRDLIESQMKSHAKCYNEYRQRLRYLSIISSVYENTHETNAEKPGETNTNAENPGETNTNAEEDIKRLQNRLDTLHGLKNDDYHYAGPLFLGLLCVRALKAVTIRDKKLKVADDNLDDLLSGDPDKLRSALEAALKDPVVGIAMRDMEIKDPDKLCSALGAALKDPVVDIAMHDMGTRVLVRPRFVCGDDPPQGAEGEGWCSRVLSGDVFSWACAEDNAGWVCPPGAFGPLEKMIRVEGQAQIKQAETKNTQ